MVVGHRCVYSAVLSHSVHEAVLGANVTCYIPTPPRRRFKMGADGSRRRSSAASHEALPLGRPHGPYESCLPFKGFGRARTSDLVWSRRLTVLVVDHMSHERRIRQLFLPRKKHSPSYMHPELEGAKRKISGQTFLLRQQKFGA